MQTSAQSFSARRLCLWPAAAALAISVSACASGPAKPEPQASATPVTHNCKPQETVGFSCELRDHRLLSLCASPDFLQFKGKPMDNPGYAYVAVGTPQGQVQASYPADPGDYKQHMSFSMSLAGAWPHLFVKTEKGSFLHFSLDEKSPVDARVNNQPAGWQLTEQDSESLCKSQINRSKLDPFMAQMVDKASADMGQPSKAAQ